MQPVIVQMNDGNALVAPEGTRIVLRCGEQVIYATPGAEPLQIEPADMLFVEIVQPRRPFATYDNGFEMPDGYIDWTDRIAEDPSPWLGPFELEGSVPLEGSVDVAPHPQTRAIDEEFGWVDAQEVIFD